MRPTGAALALALAMGLSMGVAAGPAQAADEPPAGENKSSATVGIRTGTASGGDDRGVYEYEVLPRGVVQDWVAVSNYRHRPITVRLFAKDATTSADSPFAVQQSSEKPQDVGAWIALKKNKLTIPPRSEIVVPFQLGVPHNATPGDHAGAIVVSLLAKEPGPDGAPIIVDHRVGMRLHLRVPGDLKPQLGVENVQVDWDGEGDLLGRGDARVTYTVRNTGNVRMSATGDVEISRKLGLPSVTSEAPRVEDILPGGAATYTRVIEDVMGAGPMNAMVSLHGVPVDPALEDRTSDVHKSVSFAAYPWLVIAVVAGLLALLVGGGWYGRRRRKSRRLKEADVAADPTTPGEEARETGVLVRAVLLAVAILGLSNAPASAADEVEQWQARLSKKQGVAGEPFDIFTSGGCPRPATNIVGLAYGKGFPEEGGMVVSNSDGGVSHEGPFRAVPADNMVELMAMQANPVQLSGVYKFEVRCITPGWEEHTGSYVVAIKFDNPNHWHVIPPLVSKKGPNMTGGDDPDVSNEPEGANPGGDPAATQPAGPGSSDEPPPDGEATDSAEDARARAAELTGVHPDAAENDADGTGDSVTWLYLAGGLAVLGATAAFWFRKPRS